MTIPIDMLENLVAITKNLKKLGLKFNVTLIENGKEVAAEMREDMPKGMSFEVALAITSSWLVYSGQATHAKKILDVLRTKDTDLIEDFRHPRGNTVRRSMEVWMQAMANWPDNYCPTADEVWDHYEAHIKGSAKNCRWGVLAPVKLYSIVNDWPDKDINRFIQPMGKFVRKALDGLFGLEIADPETTTGHHQAHRVQLHLAHLGKTNVTVINSGLWSVGEKM